MSQACLSGYKMNFNVTLWYFADPMCSWCWGFSPVLDEIKKYYGITVNIALMLGGLRPGNTAPMTEESRAEILHHWHEVQKMTGQKFDFTNPLPEGFVYDTEPASRAVIAISEIQPEITLPYFKHVQEAFYGDQKDVTNVSVLAELAGHFGIEKGHFLELYGSEIAKEKTRLHFQHTRQAGIKGFPTLVIQTDKVFKVVASGYRPFVDIKNDIDAWLQENSLSDVDE